MKNWMIIVALLAACGNKSSESAPQPAPRNDTITAKTANHEKQSSPKDGDTSVHRAEPEGGLETSLPYDARTLCESRCLLLAEHAYASLSAGGHAKLCRDYNADEPWPGIDADDCDQYDILRNCIFASHGKVFKKLKYQEHFADTSWYKPDPSFEGKSLSELARSNVTQLKAEASKCRGEREDMADGKVLAQTKGDLDGDGTQDEIVVGETHIWVGELRLLHNIDSIRSARLRVQVVDINRDDRFQELVVSFEEMTDNIQYLIYRFGGGELALMWTSPPWVDIQFPAEGTMTTRASECGEVTNKVWKRKGQKIEVHSEKKTGKHDPGLCAG